MKEEQRRISANLPESLYVALMAEAEREERSVGVVIKRAVVLYLDVIGQHADRAEVVKYWEEPELPLQEGTGGDE